MDNKNKEVQLIIKDSIYSINNIIKDSKLKREQDLLQIREIEEDIKLNLKKDNKI